LAVMRLAVCSGMMGILVVLAVVHVMGMRVAGL
jgi:hypothetical protein